MIKVMVEDMKFNLDPVADVYKYSNPEVEETIACVEGLARVPQQVMKWGYLTTRETMKELYRIYYNEVIPSLINNYELMTKKIYKRNTSKSKTIINFLRKINIFNLKKKEFKTVREI